MKTKETIKQIITILIAAIILAIAISFTDTSLIASAFISFIIIISLNVIAKKIYAYYLEADVKIKFWEWHQYWFRVDSHFKKPLPMIWFPLFISLITRGLFWWLAVIQFDVHPRTERVSRKHGLYRFSEMTEWHIALIATIGIITNLVLAIIGYVSGFEVFARLNIYFAFWSIIPLSKLDGNKIFFGSKALWITMFIITTIFLGYALFSI